MAYKSNHWQLKNGVLQSTNPLGYDILIKGANKYLNFGNTSGSGGYGFRDLSGDIQFKNSGGEWKSIYGIITGGTSFDVISFNTSYVPTGLEPIGSLYYDLNSRGLEFVIDQYGSVTLGNEAWEYLTNLSGGELTNGNVVSIVGATGNRQAMSKTDCTNSALSLACYGMVTVPSILNNNVGRITTKGLVRNLNTLGMTEGQPVWIDPINPGDWTQSKPEAPNYLIYVGIVVVAHATEGIIAVDIRISPKLSDLSDVNGSPLNATGLFPVWNNSTKVFDFTSNINDFTPKSQNNITKDPTGFDTPETLTITGNPTNRTVTLTGTFNAYYRGELNTTLVNGWTSPAHDSDTAKSYFLIYDGSTISWIDRSTITEDFFSNLQICVAFYLGGQWRYQREPHGLMNWQSHREFHQAIGTYRRSGGTMSGYTLNSTTATDRRPAVSSALIYDEDLPTTITSLASGTYTNFYLSSSSTPNISSTSDIVPLSTNQPYYNQFTGGAWQQTLMSTGYYMSIWLVAVPMASDSGSQTLRFLWVQGQTQNQTLANEQGLTPNSVSLGSLTDLTPEVVFIGRVIIRYVGGNWQLIQVDNLTGTRTSQVSSPAGNYLSSVTTDSTLTGIGTVSSPLGVDTITSSQVSDIIDTIYDETKDLRFFSEKYEYTDDFSNSSSSEWQQPSYGLATTSIANGLLNVSYSDYSFSLVYNRNSIFRNGIYTVKVLNNTNWGQIHMRESDQNNFLYIYLRHSSQDLRVGTKIGGAFTAIVDTNAIANYSATEGYTITAKLFNDGLNIIITDSNNDIVMTAQAINSGMASMAGVLNGVGAATGNVTYDDFASKEIEEYKNIIFLGDSITYGYGLDNRYAEAFPGIIQKYFIDDNVGVANLGVSGLTIDGLEDLIDGTTDTILDDNYITDAENHVYIMIGTNDIAQQGQTGAQAWTDYQSLISTIKGLSDSWIIHIMTVTPRSDSATYSGHIRDLNESIRSNHVTLDYDCIDMYSLLVDPADDDAILAEYDQDGRHITVAGNQVIAEKLLEKLKIKFY